LRLRFGRGVYIRKTIGLFLIVLGAIGIVWASGGAIGTRQNIGHVLFLCAGLAWACYTVAMRRAKLDDLHAAAIAAGVSLVVYLPIYAFVAGRSLLTAPAFDVALQAVVQGILTAIVALLLYGRMVSLLGATAGAAFAVPDDRSGLSGSVEIEQRIAHGRRLPLGRVEAFIINRHVRVQVSRSEVKQPASRAAYQAVELRRASDQPTAP
jgi:hypothetical protein